MKRFKSSAIRLTADEFTLLLHCIRMYSNDLARYEADYREPIMKDLNSLENHMYREFLDSKNIETYPDPDEEEI